MAIIKIPTVILFCKRTALYILHKKNRVFVNGHSAPFCIFFVTLKTNFRSTVVPNKSDSDEIFCLQLLS